MDYVKMFIDKVCNESPEEVEFTINKLNFNFKKSVNGKSKKALFSYEGKTLGDNKLNFEFHHSYIPDTPFNRFELKTPGRKAQITCFHFNNLGFTKGEPIIDITQTIKLSGRNKAENKIKKELLLKLLENEGLIDINGSNKWYLGTFNNEKQDWLYGKDTKSFISDFLKLGVILANIRGAIDINLDIDPLSIQ